MHQVPLHYVKIGIWCAMSAKRVVGPIFFNETVNSERYMSTAVEQVVAYVPVMQWAWVRSSVRTSFLGEVSLWFFLTCKTNVRKLQAHKVPEYHLAIIIHNHFIMGANDLRC